MPTPADLLRALDARAREFRRLIAEAPALLALAHEYAAECGECGGTGVMPDGNGGDEPCDDPQCQRVRALIARAEGRS